MDDQFVVTCPYCGEEVEIYLEPDLHGSFVQDCEVCCNPWRVRVSWRAFAVVELASGSLERSGTAANDVVELRTIV